MISKGGGGQLLPVFRHVPSRLRQVSCVLVAVVVVVVDEGELAPFRICKESERSDGIGDTARDVGSSAKTGEKYALSSIRVVSEAGVGCSDNG